jgi:glycosyltransferase involved in cell wall biosynthesis
MACQEAWWAGRPVLANGRSAVLRDQIQRSGGGWVYDDFESFAHALNETQAHPDLRAAHASKGRRFVEANYDWDKIDADYEFVIQTVAARTVRNARTEE